MTVSPTTHPALTAFYAVIFDFDGTLVDSNSIKRQVFLDVAKSHNIPEKLMIETLDTPELGDRTKLFLHVADRVHRSSAWAKEAESDFTRLCEERISAAAEIPGASNALTTLQSKKIPTYLCSNTPDAPLKAIVKNRKLDGFFKKVVGGPVPKVENTRGILMADHLDPKFVLGVGDTNTDREAAESCGCFYAGLTNEFSNYKRSLAWSLSRVDDILK